MSKKTKKNGSKKAPKKSKVEKPSKEAIVKKVEQKEAKPTLTAIAREMLNQKASKESIVAKLMELYKAQGKPENFATKRSNFIVTWLEKHEKF